MVYGGEYQWWIGARRIPLKDTVRPLKNVQFCSSSRKASIGQKRMFCKGLNMLEASGLRVGPWVFLVLAHVGVQVKRRLPMPLMKKHVIPDVKAKHDPQGEIVPSHFWVGWMV